MVIEHVILFQAVKHLHDNNLVHVDIKPDNIFISYEGVCKLGDFGLVIDLAKVRRCLQGHIEQSVSCMTADPGVLSLIPAQSRTFVEIDREKKKFYCHSPPFRCLIHSRSVVV